MSIQVKRRREAASFLATCIGAQGELLVDTTNNRVQVHDGATPGGWPAAKLGEVAGLAPVQSVAGRTGAVALSIADVSGAAPSSSPALAGTPTAPTAAPGTNSAQLATTSFVAASFVSYAYAAASYATVANATLTGTPTAPTPPAGDNSTKLATSAFVSSAIVAAATTPLATVAQSASGAALQIGVLEQLMTLSGSSTTSTIQIPNRAIVLGVASRTVTAVTGAPSYGVGVSGNTTQFGGSLGASAGSTNAGVIGPTAFYSPTPLVITATSGSFTGGQVRVAIHYLLCGVPAS